MVRTALLIAILVACKGNEPSSPQPKAKPPTPAATTTPPSKVGSPVARGTLKHPKVETGYGVAVAAGANLAALEKLAREKGPTYEVARAQLADLFSEEQLAFLTKNLPADQATKLKASPGVILLRGSGSDGPKLAREIAAVTRKLAEQAKGWVIDPETFEIYDAAAFADHVPGDHLDARKLIVVHSIMGGNEQPFLDTAGLRRYGFPELYVAETATGHVSQITHFINGVAQALLDGGDVNERGEITVDFSKLNWDLGTFPPGTGKATLKLRWAKERDAHADDDLVVELVPSVGSGTEGLAKMIVDCFGAEPEKISMLEDDDPEILAAAAKARADLTKLRSHFARGIPPDERLTVKAKFTEGGDDVEWMWVDVVAFKGGTLEGTLANEPEWIKSLENGQKVKVKLADVGDYVHEKKGEKPAGGYSIAVAKKRGLIPADYEP